MIAFRVAGQGSCERLSGAPPGCRSHPPRQQWARGVKGREAIAGCPRCLRLCPGLGVRSFRRAMARTPGTFEVAGRWSNESFGALGDVVVRPPFALIKHLQAANSRLPSRRPA